MQIIRFLSDLIRFHYGFIIELWVGCAEPLAWLCPDEGGAEVRPEAWGGGDCAELQAWLRPDEGGVEVRPEAGVVRLAGRVGVFGWLAREGWKEGGKRLANQKPNPLRWGVLDWMEFLALALCVGKCVGRGQSQKPSHCGLGHS